MTNIDEQILRAAKEIVVKFIEAGRISPSGFNETFINVYRTIDKTTRDSIRQSRQDESAEQAEKDKPEKKHKKKN
jgi:hypothetical protein